MTTVFNTTEVVPTFQRKPCYRYIRKTDNLPIEIDWDAEATDIILKIKLFNPTGIGTWWIASYDPESEIAFGVAELFERESGSFSMDELVEFRGVFGLPIERDLYYTPRTLAEVLNNAN